MQKVLRFLGEFVVMWPFLAVVYVLDFVIGLILPYKYGDSTLPSKDAVLSRQVDPSDPSSPYRSTLTNDIVRLDGDKYNNIYKTFAEACKAYADQPTMGVRDCLNLEDEVQPNGKVFKKYNLANSYTWSTYKVLLERVNNLSNGLLTSGIQSDQNVVLFSETRPEWIITALACMRIKAPVVTLYATLGIDALVYGINQTSAPLLVTSGDQLPKLQKILNKIPNITHIVVFTDKFTEKNFVEFKKLAEQLGSKIKLYSMSELEKIGQDNKESTKFKQPHMDDLAIIMYTSGSTGI